MKKQEIIQGLPKTAKAEGFITATKFAQYMGCTNISKCRDKYLADLERVEEKYYFIPDVAEVLMSRRTN